jgi:hypothetical protein
VNYLEAFLEEPEPPAKNPDSYTRSTTEPTKLDPVGAKTGSVGSVGSPTQVCPKIEAVGPDRSKNTNTYPESPTEPTKSCSVGSVVLPPQVYPEIEPTQVLPQNSGETHLDVPAKPTKPQTLLVGPHLTPWGTVVYSAPDALPIELFGPAPPPGAPGDDLRAEPTHKAAEPDPRNSADTYPEDPRKPRKPLPPIAVVRRIVADWPIPLRERWGRRANELADAGVPHPEDERQAFVELQNTSPEEPPTPCRPKETCYARDTFLPF